MFRIFLPASLLAALFACSLQAAVIEIFPGQSFEAAAENLSAGDTLIVHAGEYTHTSRIAITVLDAGEPPPDDAPPGDTDPGDDPIEAPGETESDSSGSALDFILVLILLFLAVSGRRFAANTALHPAELWS